MSWKLLNKLTPIVVGSIGGFTIYHSGNFITPRFKTADTSWTTNYKPSVEWDFNWDHRAPTSVLKPLEKDASPEKENEYNEKLDKLRSKATRHIILVRHGQYNLDGSTDAERSLTELGRNQAKLTGQRLADLKLPIDEVVISTMTRAQETGKLILEQLPHRDLLLVQNDPLIEEGAPVKPEPSVDHWNPSPHEFFIEGSRIEAGFRAHIHRAEPSQKDDSYTLLVCHGNVIRYFVCRALQFSPEAWLRLNLHHASITWLVLYPSGRVSLRLFGDCGHMEKSHLCGRTCLTIEPTELKEACKQVKKTNVNEYQTKKVEYRNEYNLGREFNPSYNISPGEICPILVSAKHCKDEADGSDLILLPALWGIVPRWHVGDYKKHGLTTNNIRLENLETSKMYKPALDQGRRCVIPIEGFYEWQTINPKLKSSERAAYYIYMPQQNDVKIEDKSTWNIETVELMYVAGLFDVWHDDNGDSLFSFSTITFESNEKLNWLHHRTPAIIESGEQISKWLDYDRVSPSEALKVIRQPEKIIWHEVSNYVNSSRNKAESCNKPKSSQKEPTNSVLSWIKKRNEAKKDFNK